MTKMEVIQLTLTLKINEIIPEWSSLLQFRNHFFIKSSYIWFVSVPMLNKLFNKIGDNLTFNIFEQPMTIEIGLPFSWFLFFCGSLLFAIGNLLCTSLCPYFFKISDTFSDFQEKGFSFAFLKEISNKIGITNFEDLKLKNSEKDLYWHIRDKYSQETILSRRFIFFTYFIGSIIFLLVSVQNVFSVFLSSVVR